MLGGFSCRLRACACLYASAGLLTIFPSFTTCIGFPNLPVFRRAYHFFLLHASYFCVFILLFLLLTMILQLNSCRSQNRYSLYQNNMEADMWTIRLYCKSSRDDISHSSQGRASTSFFSFPSIQFFSNGFSFRPPSDVLITGDVEHNH